MTRVAAVQMRSGPDVQPNLAAAAELIRSAVEDDCQLVVLPENFALMPADESDRLAAVEADGAGPIQDFLSAQAKEHNIWLVGGTIPLQSSRPDRVRAACLLINDRGERVARYDKIHLFDVQLESGDSHEESRTIEAGDRVVVTGTPFGRLGLAVCYDLRFPRTFPTHDGRRRRDLHTAGSLHGTHRGGPLGDPGTSAGGEPGLRDHINPGWKAC